MNEGAEDTIERAGPVADARALRAALVDGLRNRGVIHSNEVENAFRKVARQAFLPDVSLEAAYADDAVVTKRDANGVAISSVSAPSIVALMLEQLQVRRGHRVLEVGSGGYNAALLAELVGQDGHVTSVDIDQDVIDRARECLAAAGYDHVQVLCADGEFGAERFAPFDRIVVTVGAWDVPPAWAEQLARNGRLVVPLRMRGLTRSVAFEREDGYLAGREYGLCGFVPMQGVGAYRERLIDLHGDLVRLRVDDEQPVNVERLRQALVEPRTEAWSGVTAGSGERFDGLHLWLALNLSEFGLLAADQEAVGRGLVAHAWPLGVPTALGSDGFAYLTLRAVTPARERFEFGAYGHGPDGRSLAEHMAGLIRSWDGSSLNAQIRRYPAGTPDAQFRPDAVVLDKRHSRVSIAWPGADLSPARPWAGSPASRSPSPPQPCGQ